MSYSPRIWLVIWWSLTTCALTQPLERLVPLADGGAIRLAQDREAVPGEVVVTRLDAKGHARELARLPAEASNLVMNAIAIKDMVAVVIADSAAHRIDLTSGAVGKIDLPAEWTSVAANRAGFLLGGYQDKLMESADGRTWKAQAFKAPGEGFIEGLDLDGPTPILLRTSTREENGWHLIASEICRRDQATGVWRKLTGLEGPDGGNGIGPLVGIKWVGGQWLARGMQVIVTVASDGATETIEPKSGDGRYLGLSGDEPITKTGERWRMFHFSEEVESTDLKTWRLVREFPYENRQGQWLIAADGEPKFYGTVGKAGGAPGFFAAAALVTPIPVPASKIATRVPTAPAPSVKSTPTTTPAAVAETATIPDSALVVSRAAAAKEPKTAEEFFNRGLEQLKSYQNEGALADFKRAAEMGASGGMLQVALMYQSGQATQKPDGMAGLRWWERGARAGHPQAIEDVSPNADLDRARKLADEGDWVNARKAYEKAAAAGHGMAQNALGEMYLEGLTVVADLARAKTWFEKAAAEHKSSWAGRRLDNIAGGYTPLQMLAENAEMKRNMDRVNASFKGKFVPLPAVIAQPTQAQIDATIKRSPWTYKDIAAALAKNTNHGALAAAIRVDGGDFYEGELAKLEALPQVAAEDDYSDLHMALIGAKKAGAGPWARAAAAQAIAERRAQLTAPPGAWTDSLALRRRAAQGELAALYQFYGRTPDELTLGALPELISKQLVTLAEHAVQENYAPALWLAGEKLEYRSDAKQKNPAQVAVYYRASAEAGDAEGAWRLAQYYHRTADHDTKAEGVAPNYLAAEHWYIEAGARARPGQKIGFMTPEECLYQLYSFTRPVGSTGFAMRADAADLRWARELLRRGGPFAEIVDVKLAALRLEDDKAAVIDRILAELPPEGPALSTAKLQRLTTAAQAGEAAAALQLGDAYATGRGVLQDDVAANRWFERAAELGDAMAMRRLEQQYTHGRGVPVDTAKQVAWLRRAAEAGDAPAWLVLGRKLTGEARIAAFEKAADSRVAAEALFELADTYRYGRGEVPKDEVKSLDHARRAVAAGSVRAMGWLGLYYSYEKKDPQAAIPYYRQAVAAGDKSSRAVLAGLLKQTGDQASAEAVYRLMAEDGDVVGQAKLGYMLYESGREDEAMSWLRKVAGSPATEQQQLAAKMVARYEAEEKAAPGTQPWLERRARRGDNDARFELARLVIKTERGWALQLLNEAASAKHAPATALYYAIMAADNNQTAAAAMWLDRQVEEENPQAILMVGQLLVKSDMAGALQRIERAAALGNPEAKFHLGMAKYHGQQVAQDRAAGVKLLSEAAEANFASAQFTLGKGLLGGDVELPADPKGGLALLEKAATQNLHPAVSAQASMLLGQVYESGKVPGIPRDLEKAVPHYERAAEIDARNTQLRQYVNQLRSQLAVERKNSGRM